MGLSKEIILTVKNYEVNLDKNIKFYENDTIDLCFSILEYGIEVKDGVTVNKLMPINALKAYMLIETPQGVDYAESTIIEDNRVVFNLGDKYSQFIGIGKMQIVIKDSDGCRVTLPEFPFEIRESINSDWDRDITVLSTEASEIIVDEFGREIALKKISEMEEANTLPINSYSLVLDNDKNKKIKTNLITQKVENDLQLINEQLETMENNNLKYIKVTNEEQFSSAVINSKTTNRPIYVASKITLDNSYDVTGIKIFSDGIESGCGLFLTGKQIDMLKSKGNTVIENLVLDGGWDGSTKYQSGDILSCVDGENFISRITLNNVKIINAKRNAISFSRVGYSCFNNVKVNACGNNAVDLYKSTSLTTIGSCVYSDCPNGFGISIEDCHNINFNGDITEYTKGIMVKGNENRALNFNGVYEEFISGNKYITLEGAGIGLNIIGAFGGATSIDYNSNFYGVNIINCTNLTLPKGDCNNWGLIQTNNSFKLEELTLNKLNIKNNSYNLPITIKDYSIWIDPNTSLRIKQGEAISDYDGYIIPKWVEVPNRPTSFGIEGQMAKDDAYLYICTSNSNWTRIQLTSW